MVVAGERIFFRLSSIKASITGPWSVAKFAFYFEIEGPNGWDMVTLWDPRGREALKALRSLARHNPFVPSNEGVKHLGY
jgi:uncharacterized protein (DUF2461 family)